MKNITQVKQLIYICNNLKCYPGEQWVNCYQKRGKGKLQLFCVNGEWLIPIYATNPRRGVLERSISNHTNRLKCVSTGAMIRIHAPDIPWIGI